MLGSEMLGQRGHWCIYVALASTKGQFCSVFLAAVSTNLSQCVWYTHFPVALRSDLGSLDFIHSFQLQAAPNTHTSLSFVHLSHSTPFALT